jgi:hypothetical protein
MSQKHVFVYRILIVVLTVILVITLVQSPRATQAAPQAAGAQMLDVSVFEVDCLYKPSVDENYAKLGNLATFTVRSADSFLELVFNGRFYISSFTDSSGALFELRVDDSESSIGLARANMWMEEANTPGLPISITGIFKGLAAGEHTASIWVRTLSGSANTAVVNPGCWGGDVLIVKEHLPFGVAYLPMITK